jgi:hypothetical protein
MIHIIIFKIITTLVRINKKFKKLRVFFMEHVIFIIVFNRYALVSEIIVRGKVMIELKKLFLFQFLEILEENRKQPKH